jgi:hypothetical protein
VIRFERADRGLRVVDTIEEVEYVVEAGPITPEPAETALFPAPVDDAVRIRTTRLYLPTVVDYHLRGADGEPRERAAGSPRVVEETAFFEATNTPMKLYLRFDSPATVEDGENGTRIRFDEPSTVVVGPRSLHQRPEGTVTVPETPAGIARGLSVFSSALKTTSPERSFPTLRGHPPLLEFGQEFDAGGLSRPETGIRLEVPERYSSVFTVAPLAYYLGAEIVTGVESPRLVAGAEPFPLEGDLREATANTLRHCFLLDCITRTEGLYPVSLRERTTLAERTTIAPERWYELPIAERTAAYLAIPKDTTADLLDWHLTADIEPAAGNAEILPFIVDDLAIVRSPTPLADRGSPPPEPDDVDDFFRTGGAPRRLRRATERSDAVGESVISPVETDTYGHIWVGETFPMGSSKPTVDAYRRRLDRQPSDDSTTTVTLVCNDEEMLAEIDEELYGFFDMLTFEVRSHHDLTKAELREVLQTDTSFLHYVGHVEDDGVQCADGVLDLRTLSGTGVDAFLLNGCTSYEQGQALVDAGAYGGVVTLTSVSNTKATKTGTHLAHLLDIGFDFHGALDVIRRIRISRQNYVVVGDGSVTISQSTSGLQYMLEIDLDDPDRLSVNCVGYPTSRFKIGTMGRTFLEEEGVQYIPSGEFSGYEVSRERFQQLMGDHRMPVLLDGDLRWSNRLDFG